MSTQERTYTAPRLETALAQIKRELGQDAVILSSRRARRGVEVRAVAAEAGRIELQGSGGRSCREFLESLLQKNGLDRKVAKVLSVDAPNEPGTLQMALDALTEALRSRFLFRPPTLEFGRRVLAVVGPTGVGKTTTLAKLAARSALVDRRAVALVTLDSYRVGATAQLEQYADLIGIPMLTATDAESLGRCFRRLADAEVIFVDTAGRAPRDREAFSRLAETLHGTDEEVDVTLCLSATSRDLEIEDAVERHAVLLPKTLTVTKLDEAARHDAVVSAHLVSGLPIGFFTTGQRVPEDLEDASPERLAAALCGEEVYA